MTCYSNNKVIGNTHSKQRTNKATGMTIKTRPTTGNLYSNLTFNGKVGIANQLDHCSPVQQVEVSEISPCCRVTKNLTTRSDKQVQGTINAVAPVIETNASHENELNTECKAPTKNDSPNKEGVELLRCGATEFPEDIEAYLKEEVQFGAILGPFHTDPIPDCHRSPFMTREKPNSTHRRVIVDLSWPKGFSVNTGVNKGLVSGHRFCVVTSYN